MTDLTSFRPLLVLLASCSFFACAATKAGPAANATITAAEVGPAAAEAPPPAAEEQSARSITGDGELVCRTKDAFGMVSELRVVWAGKQGTGVLRQTAPSGMTSELRVRAEREGDVLFADDLRAEPDLLVHAASVTRRDGKSHIRLGDAKQSWSPCE